MIQTSFDNYMVVGDIAVVAVCLVMIILLMTSFVNRNRSYYIFINIIGMLMLVALVNISYHALLTKNDPAFYTLIYVQRILYHALLFNTFFLFTLYITVVSEMDHAKARKIAIFSNVLFFAIIGYDFTRSLICTGFGIQEDGTVINKTNIYVIGYLIYVLFLMFLMRWARSYIYRRAMLGFYGTMLIAIVIRIAQLPLRQSSLTTMTFVFPVIAMMYIIHSNPYNLSTGTVNIQAIESYVADKYRRKIPFIFMSLQLLEFDAKGNELPEDIRTEVRRISTEYFKGCVVFQLGNGHLILMASKRKNPDYEQKIEAVISDFRKQYDRFQQPFKIVVGESDDEVSRINGYVGLIRSINSRLPENSIYRVESKDNERFNQADYVLNELTDIYNKHDPEDERVLVFCQPVFNLQTGRFDTAEALMRLDLEKTGIVFPDMFIPMAENNGFIHILT